MQNFLEIFQHNFLTNNRYLYLVNGLTTTIKVTIFSLVIGLTFGLMIALIRASHKDLKPEWTSPSGFFHNLFNKISSIFVTIIRGTPSTLQLLIMFNIILKNLDNLEIIAILTFGLNSAAYISEIFRGGIQSVSPGEKEAARSLGLTYMQTSRFIVIPQAFKYSLPSMGNEIITLFKETSISGFIGLMDLTRGSTILLSQTFQAIPPYLASGIIYLSIVLILERVFKKIEERTDYARN